MNYSDEWKQNIFYIICPILFSVFLPRVNIFTFCLSNEVCQLANLKLEYKLDNDSLAPPVDGYNQSAHFCLQNSFDSDIFV